MGYEMRPEIPYKDGSGYEENSGPGKAFPGAPVCEFRGKRIPSVVAMSPKGSITSDILKLGLQCLDDLNVYPREAGGPVPFALFDAHDSRLQLPFLKYVNEKVNDRPKWKACIGLPNGTALWQVGDLLQQNGCWKMAWYREKDNLVRYKERMGMEPKLVRDDIIPLVNRAWKASFARKKQNLVAIRERWWNPLDWQLLKLPTVVRTQQSTTAESTSDSPLQPPPEIDVEGGDEVSTITSDSLADLNFFSGVAKEYSIDFLQYLIRRKEVNSNLQKRYTEGKLARGRLDEAKKLTGGIMFKSAHIVLDDEVASLRRERENKKLLEIEKPICNAILEYKKRRLAYQSVRDLNIPEAAYGKREYKAIVHFLKTSDAPAVPQNAGPIKARYEEVKGHREMTLPEYLSDRGYKGETMKRVLSTFIDNEGKESMAEWM